jgi:DNA polymerase III alpha subunit (gram-positive type)
MYELLVIVGNVAKVSVRKTKSGCENVVFSVATNVKKGNSVVTTWWKCIAFEETAQLCKDIKKGDVVSVWGVIEPDRNTGSPRLYTTGKGETRADYLVRVHAVSASENVAKHLKEKENDKDSGSSD